MSCSATDEPKGPSASEGGEGSDAVIDSPQEKPEYVNKCNDSNPDGDFDNSFQKMVEQMDEKGMAKVQIKFLKRNYKPVLDTTYMPAEAKELLENMQSGNSDGSEPPKKKMKLTGRNKKRPTGKRLDASARLCPSLKAEKVCFYGNKCKFSHNVEVYMAEKLPDIGPTCYLYDTLGKCPFGLACRYAKSHIGENFKNCVNEPLFEEVSKRTIIYNQVDKDLQACLRKRKYNFQKSNEVVQQVLKTVTIKRNIVSQSEGNEKLESGKSQEVDMSNSGSTQSSDHMEPNCYTSKPADSAGSVSLETDRTLGTACVSILSSGAVETPDAQTELLPTGDSDNELKIESATSVPGIDVTQSGLLRDDGVIKLRPQEKKKIDFSDKLYLAPLTTVGNLPFRRVCKQFGADITCGEMAMCTNLLQGQSSEWALLKRHESEDIFGVQLCGAYPDSMTKCAQLLTEKTNIDFIDINVGCPIDLIFKRGEGSALMGKATRFEQIVKSMSAVMDIPLTVKTRTGIFNDKNIAHNLVPKLRDWGVSLVTLHGRSREQRYTKLADWDYIKLCAEVAKPMPLFGNGDILSYEDANLRRQQFGVNGLMIARGALIKPWLFTEIKEQRHWDISSSERFDILKDFTNYGLQHWGSDTQGVETTRRFLLEWLSFLYRYIPVGVLERLPQRINEKPPHYFGRNDLETLMSSPNCADWVRMSEMLLGKVPEGFTFLPKHKANSFK